MTFNFTIPGKPVPQERPYVTRHGAFDRPKSAAAKRTVRLIAQGARSKARFTASKGDFGVSCMFYGAHGGADIDNLLKLILDALKGVFWEDDRQVTSVSAMKIKSEKGKERTDVMIEELE